jgi:hypothetical protein
MRQTVRYLFGGIKQVNPINGRFVYLPNFFLSFIQISALKYYKNGNYLLLVSNMGS